MLCGSEWVYGYHMFAGACESEKSVLDPQEVELQMFRSFWDLDLAPLEGQWILFSTETASLQLQELIMASTQVITAARGSDHRYKTQRGGENLGIWGGRKNMAMCGKQNKGASVHLVRQL